MRIGETQRALDDLNEKLNCISNVKPTNKPSNPLIDNDFQPAYTNFLIKLSKRKLSKGSVSDYKKQKLSEVQVIRTPSALPPSSVRAPISRISSKNSGFVRLSSPKMHKTFAQAAKSAKIHYMERFGKSVFSGQDRDAKLELNLDFNKVNESLSSLSMSGSSISSLVSNSPSSLPIMEALNLSFEQDLTLNLTSFALSDKKHNLSDSFSSNPESNFNKGADIFAALVERAIAYLATKEKELNFERLLVQMMDLGVNESISSAFDIPKQLENMGWSFEQVSSLWSVSSAPGKSSSWSRVSLEEIGGKGALSRVWMELKDEGKTRCDMRKSPEDLEVRLSSPVKYRKMDGVAPTNTQKKQSKLVSFKSKHFINRKAAALTPDVVNKPRQTKMTSWLSEGKIGAARDKTHQKRNPNPLIPPCGPSPAPRRLFSMKDAPEDFQETMAAKESLQNKIPADPAPSPAPASSRRSKTPAPKKATPSQLPIPPKQDQGNRAAPQKHPGAQSSAKSRADLPTIAKNPSLLHSQPAPEAPRGRAAPKKSTGAKKTATTKSDHPKKPNSTESPSSKPLKNPALSNLPKPANQCLASERSSQKDAGASPTLKSAAKQVESKILKIDRSKFHSMSN